MINKTSIFLTDIITQTEYTVTGIDKNEIRYYQIGVLDTLGFETLGTIKEAGGENTPSNMVVWFPYSGDAMDKSGNGNHGQIYGAGLAPDRFGVSTRAFYFDGIDDYIQIPHSESLNLDPITDDYTISIWVKSNNPQHGRVLSKWGESGGPPYPFSIHASPDGCHINIYDGRGTSIRLEYGHIWDNRWHHMVYIINAETQLISGYLDTNFVNTLENYYTNSCANTNDVYIGILPTRNLFYKGYIDDIAIYNYALGEDEIVELYHSGGWGHLLF